MIPALRADGTLPPGIHVADDWDEITRVFGGTPARRALLRRLREGLENLRAAGCPWVLLDGSFTTSKPQPADVDGCWEWQEDVDLITLDRIFLLLNATDRADQKARYGTDFFIADMIEAGSGQPFAEFFQMGRNGERKGIVRFDLDRL